MPGWDPLRPHDPTGSWYERPDVASGDPMRQFGPESAPARPGGSSFDVNFSAPWWRARGRGHAGRGPRNWRRSDEAIRDEVCQRMADHPDLDPGRFQVRVENGEVTLQGEVDLRFEKRLAEDLAASVRGVDDVHNRLRVAPAGRDVEAAAGSPQGRPAP